MPSIDMPLEQLRQYKPALYRESDFESFWDSTIADATNQALNAELIPYHLPLAGLQAYAVRFDGFGGGRLAGWYLRPTSRGKFPGVCMYHGYSGRGQRLLSMVPYAAQGMCVLSMDCRGQNGESQDLSASDSGHALGWMSKGIRSPQQYYYRFVYADAIRALEVLARREEVDEKRLAVTGESQGGGISLAVAALSERVALALADAPFLCDFSRGMTIAQAGPYLELTNFLRSFPSHYEQSIRTLSYCDCLNLAQWITCRTIVSASLWDDICPPSTVFAVYNHLAADKQIEIYPFHKHETPYEHQEIKFRAIVEMFLK